MLIWNGKLDIVSLQQRFILSVVMYLFEEWYDLNISF